MKIKSMLLSAVTAITMLSASVTAQQAKEVPAQDTVVYHYLYSDYATGGDVNKGAGITRPTNDYNWVKVISPSWGTPTKSMVGTLNDVWWFASSKSVNNTSAPSTNPQNYVKNTIEQNYASVNLDKEGLQGDCSDGIIELVLDYGVMLTASNTSTPYMKLPITGITEDGEQKVIAMPVMNGDLLYFEGVPQSKRAFIPKVSVNGSNKAGQRTYIKILFDMRKNTYSAYYLKKSKTGDAAESTAAPEMIINNVPFYNGSDKVITKVSKLDVCMKSQSGSDQFAPIEIKMTKLGSDSIHMIDTENAAFTATPYTKENGDLVEGLEQSVNGKRHWLESTESMPVTVTENTKDGTLSVGNGIIERVFNIPEKGSAKFYTKSYKNVYINRELLKDEIKPEVYIGLYDKPYYEVYNDAEVSSVEECFKDGVIKYDPDYYFIGGENSENTFIFDGYEVSDECEKPFEWTPRSKSYSDPAAGEWPPKGKHIEFNFSAPSTAPAAYQGVKVKVIYEMYDNLASMKKRVEITNKGDKRVMVRQACRRGTERKRKS